MFQDALAGEAVWEFVGDDVDDYAVGADLGGCGSIGECVGDERYDDHGRGLENLLFFLATMMNKDHDAGGYEHLGASFRRFEESVL